MSFVKHMKETKKGYSGFSRRSFSRDYPLEEERRVLRDRSTYVELTKRVAHPATGIPPAGIELRHP